MENNYTVYKHISPNGKVYIGITCRKPEQRWNNGNGYKQNQYFYNAIQKYGWENFEHTIISKNLSKEDACNLEIELIAKYKSNIADFGYNHSVGGESSMLGVKHSEETKRKIGEAFKGGHLSEEHKRKLSEANKGEKNYWYGKHFPEELKQKLSESHKGKTKSEETRKKMSEARKGEKNHMYGKSHSKEAKQKISAANKGENHPNYGKHLSEETKRKIGKAHKGKQYSEESKRKMSESHLKKVVCVETGDVYISIKEASEETGIHNTGISKCCLGKRQTAGGYHWEYYEEEEHYDKSLHQVQTQAELPCSVLSEKGLCQGDEEKGA